MARKRSVGPVSVDQYRWRPSWGFKALTLAAPSFQESQSTALDFGLSVTLENATPSIDLKFPAPRLIEEPLDDLEAEYSTDLVSFDAVETEAFDLAALLGCIRISANLFKPLSAVRTDGKRYRADDPSLEQLEAFKPRAVSRDESGYRRAFTVKKTPGIAVKTRKKMTIWDLIFPLLTAPLSYDFEHFVGLPEPLYAFQPAGVQFLAENESALLGDEMGMGKTVQAIVAMRLLFQSGRVKSTLIIVPLPLMINWDRELQKWAPTLPGVTVVYGSQEQRDLQWSMPAHVWITTYGVVRQDIEEIEKHRDFDLVVLDEIQNIKNPGTQQTKAARRLSRGRAWGLSGTPLENSLDDLISVYDFLKPGLMPRDGLTPGSAKRLIKPYFLRRRKKECLPDLPKKQAFDQWVALEGAQREAYERAEQKGRVYLEELGDEITVTHILELLTRLKQLCNRDAETGQSAKLEYLDSKLKEVAETDSKALVFSQFLAQGVEPIADRFAQYNPVLIVGGQTPRKRQRSVDRFQEDPDCRLLVATPKAGGVGLNLVAGNYVFHFDHWWNPATARQAEDRVHRIGQRKDVSVYHIWTERTVEERIREILKRKQKLYDDVIEGLSNLESTGMSEEELFGLFNLESPRTRRRTASALTESEILERLLDQSSDEFENTVKRLYEAWGYVARLTPATRDRGVDVVARKPTAGGGEDKIAVQCKRYGHDNTVGAPAVQNLLGLLGADVSYTKGVLVTTSRFSRDAYELAGPIGKLDLVDGLRLAKHLRDTGVTI